MKLYRGDSIYNDKTEPGKYRNNGLFSKAFGSCCNPKNIEIIGLRETIRMHINPINSFDLKYYDVTDFLSFSESEERALYWCRDKDSLIIVKATEYEETRYLFTLKLDNNFIRKIGTGIYLYSYNCNPSLKMSDSGEEPHLTFLKLIHGNEICLICNNINRKHKIILINSVEYLIANSNHAKYGGALESAKNDREWLMIPIDPVETNQDHRSARLPRADFWHAEHYKVIGEKRPPLNYL